MTLIEGEVYYLLLSAHICVTIHMALINCIQSEKRRLNLIYHQYTLRDRAIFTKRQGRWKSKIS